MLSLETSRRVFLRGAGGLGIAGLLSGCLAEADPVRARIGGGESGGFYLEFAQLLAAVLQEEGLSVSVVETNGSTQNIQDVRSGELDIGIALSDSIDEALGMNADLLALGRIYENYLHLLVLAESEVFDLAGLRGARVSRGAPGSGVFLTAGRVLKTAGLSGQLEEYSFGIAEALEALSSGKIQGMFWAGGVPTKAISKVSAERKMRLIDLSQWVQPMQRIFGPIYHPVTIPQSAYGMAESTPTIGVDNLLVCSSSLDERVVMATVQALVSNASRLIPSSTAGIQFLEFTTLTSTLMIPLHPLAAQLYRNARG